METNRILFPFEIVIKNHITKDFRTQMENAIMLGKMLGYDIDPWASAHFESKGGHYIIPFFKNFKCHCQFALIVDKNLNFTHIVSHLFVK